MNKEEIEALEDVLAMGRKSLSDYGLSVIEKAVVAYLKLLKGDHETLVIVPRESTMLQNVMGARSIGGTMNYLNFTDRAKEAYKAMIQESQGYK